MLFLGDDAAAMPAARASSISTKSLTSSWSSETSTGISSSAFSSTLGIMLSNLSAFSTRVVLPSSQLNEISEASLALSSL